MSRPKKRSKKTRTPAYRLHRASDQGIVTLVDGVTKRRKDVYLGSYNTPRSRDRYDAVIAQWLGRDRRLNEVRKAMVGRDWSRHYVNRQTKLIKKVFKRGVALELIEPAVYQALDCLPDLS